MKLNEIHEMGAAEFYLVDILKSKQVFEQSSDGNKMCT